MNPYEAEARYGTKRGLHWVGYKVHLTETCEAEQPRDEHEAIRAARRRQASFEFAAAYARRAGVEGAISQGVRAFGLRRARYRGLAKTHLQHVASATALNVDRLTGGVNGVPRARTRSAHFAALNPAA